MLGIAFVFHLLVLFKSKFIQWENGNEEIEDEMPTANSQHRANEHHHLLFNVQVI